MNNSHETQNSQRRDSLKHDILQILRDTSDSYKRDSSKKVNWYKERKVKESPPPQNSSNPYCSREKSHPQYLTQFSKKNSGSSPSNKGISQFCTRPRKNRPKINIITDGEYCKRRPRKQSSRKVLDDFRGSEVPALPIVNTVHKLPTIHENDKLCFFKNSMNYLTKNKEQLKTEENSLTEIEKFNAPHMKIVIEKEAPPKEENDDKSKEDSMNVLLCPMKSNKLENEEMSDEKENNSLTKAPDSPQKKKGSFTKKLAYSKNKGVFTSLRSTLSFREAVILPDDPFKMKWNALITLFLLFTAIVTPYRIAFTDEDPLEWLLVEYIVDLGFIVDLTLNFFSAYYDEDDNLITLKNKIAVHYLKTWFAIDFIAILPVNIIFQSEKRYNTLARLARIPRLYKLLKILKLTRIFRVFHARKIPNNELFSGVEKFVTYILFIFIICHLIACMWYLAAKLDHVVKTWLYRNDYESRSSFEIYMACFHFAFTIITTMGDSGIKAESPYERIVCIIAMCIGVCCYSFALSSLTSFIQTLDSSQAKLKEKLKTLETMRYEYGITYDTYIKIRKALKYDHYKSDSHKIDFIKELPQPLRLELAVIMNQDLINKVEFFQNRPPQFIAYAAPLLRPMRVHKGEYIFQEGDYIDEIYFLLSGKVAFVLEDFEDMPYIHIDEGFYFGETCIFTPNSDKRIFTVQATEDSELLALSKDDLYQIDVEFPEILSEIVKNARKRLKQCLKIKEKAYNFCNDQISLSEVSPKDNKDNHNNHQSFKKNILRTEAVNKMKSMDFKTTLRKIEEENSSIVNSDESVEFSSSSNSSRMLKNPGFFDVIQSMSSNSQNPNYLGKIIKRISAKSTNSIQAMREKHVISKKLSDKSFSTPTSTANVSQNINSQNNQQSTRNHPNVQSNDTASITSIHVACNQKDKRLNNSDLAIEQMFNPLNPDNKIEEDKNSYPDQIKIT